MAHYVFVDFDYAAGLQVWANFGPICYGDCLEYILMREITGGGYNDIAQLCVAVFGGIGKYTFSTGTECELRKTTNHGYAYTSRYHQYVGSAGEYVAEYEFDSRVIDMIGS